MQAFAIQEEEGARSPGQDTDPHQTTPRAGGGATRQDLSGQDIEPCTLPPTPYR